MSKIVIILMWGLVYKKPLLPAGYIYIEGRRDRLLAESPMGRRYYVSRNKLYRQGVKPITLSYYVDKRETIELPQKQLA